MHRLLPWIAVASLLPTTACTVAARNHPTLGVVADVTAIAGAAVFSQQQTCNADPLASVDSFDSSIDCGTSNISKFLIGTALVAAGAVLGVTAIALPPWSQAEQLPPTTALPTVASATDTVPLPVHATDDLTVRLAFQAWRTAADGRCDATRVTLRQILDRDIDYYAQLTLTPSIAGCLR